MSPRARPQPFYTLAFSIYKWLSPIYKLQVAPSNLTSAPLALNRPHLPPVTHFLNRSIILHTSHTLFCHEVHSPSSRSRCCLASKRTQNLRAILLLCRKIFVLKIHVLLHWLTKMYTIFLIVYFYITPVGILNPKLNKFL
jgi:hypothetical protein